MGEILTNSTFVTGINKIINLPILNIFFTNLDTLGQIQIIFSLISNLIIMLSYNDFNQFCDENDFRERRNREYKRLQCPHLLYDEENKTSEVIDLLKYFGIIQLILQAIIFIDYIIRLFLVRQEEIQFDYRKICVIFTVIFIIYMTEMSQ